MSLASHVVNLFQEFCGIVLDRARTLTARPVPDGISPLAGRGVEVEPLEPRMLLSVVVNTISDLPDSTTISLRDAVALANASSTPTTITFDPTVFALYQTITLNGSGLELSNAAEPTTIIGPAAGMAISGNHLSQGFLIDSGVTANLSNMFIVYCNASAISNNGTLTLTNVNLDHNSTSGNGGGILSNGSLTVNDCTLYGNAAQYGGGIYSVGTLTVTDSSLTSNTAFIGDPNFFPDGCAGAIYNNGTATVSNCIITNNSSGGSGAGGIDNLPGSALTLTNSTVSNNSTSPGGAGGAILNNGSLAIAKCTISANSCGNKGGAIDSPLGSLTITDTTISGNHATTSGGGIYSSVTARFVRTTVSGNSAGNNWSTGGGGIYSDGSLTLLSCNVSDNELSSYATGGGVFNAGSLTAQNTTISGNGAFGGGGIMGGGLLIDCTISGNSIAANDEWPALGTGGGVRGYITMINCTVADNLATVGGGLDVSGSITNCTIVDNTGWYAYDGLADGGGGGIIGSNIVINNSIVAGNRNKIGPAPTTYEPSDIVGSVTGSYNLIGDGSGLVNGQSGNVGNILGTPTSPIDPNLGALGNYGGSTQTMSPNAGSLALNAGNNAFALDDVGRALATDQRGLGRIVGAAIDLGAVEAGTPTSSTGLAKSLAFSQRPRTTRTGILRPSAIVLVRDANGNVLTTNNSTVTLSVASGPTGATLGGTVTVAAVNGVATFDDISLSVPGTYTLRATDVIDGLTAATSQSFTITPATTLTIIQQPASVWIGAHIPVIVQVQDAGGNLVTTDNSKVTISLASNPAGGTLGGTLTVVAVKGVATFNDLTLSKAGDYTFLVTDNDEGLTTATSVSFTITGATTLVFSQQPTPAAVGATLPPVTVLLKDIAGNTVTTENADVTISIASGPTGATLGGTLTVTAVNGVAIFNDLVLFCPGTYTLQAADWNDGMTPATSDSFTTTLTVNMQLQLLAPFSYSTGDSPDYGLISDANGNLYGTTRLGGANGNGTVFEVAKSSGVVTPLASFGSASGSWPLGGLAIDSSGNLYGTTCGDGANGDGTVFKVTKGSGVITPLATFSSATGTCPTGSLTIDGSGNLYGTTDYGGANSCGTVFELAKGSPTITPLASFDGTNGGDFMTGLIIDGSGNLYGTTPTGGANSKGTVFEVVKGSGKITVLASFNCATFNNTTNGGPSALILDASGDLFGTTPGDGSSTDRGTVFEVVKNSGVVTPLGAFYGGNGDGPNGGLAMDSSGNLFGTAAKGGANDDGVVFEWVKNWNTIIPLTSFNTTDMYGTNPNGMAMDGSGNLYGAASQSVFELTQMPYVNITGSHMTIQGSAANDTLTLTIQNALDAMEVAYNSQLMTYKLSQFTAIDFLGGGGNDSAVVNGGTAVETAAFTGTGGTVAAAGYKITLTGINTKQFIGQASDIGILTATSPTDIYTGKPTYSTLTGGAVSNRIDHSTTVTANAITGANTNVAYLYDSTGNDTFYSNPTYAYLKGTGFYNTAKGFNSVYGYATAGGTDTAKLYGSAGSDTLVAKPTYAYMQGTGYYNRVNSFDSVYAYAVTGGTDTASLYDSPADDAFFATPTNGYLKGAGYCNYFSSFGAVTAYATAGGTDKAYLYDSTGNDTFYATAAYAYLKGTGFDSYGSGFKSVYAYASTGTDTATLYDSAGNDTYVGNKPLNGVTSSYISGSGLMHRATGFDNVYAYATAGGTDTAYLYDTAGNDTFVGNTTSGGLTSSYMSGSGLMNRATGFAKVYAYATAGGTDTAYVYGSSGADQFHARNNWGQLTQWNTATPTYFVYFSGFDSATINSSAGSDGRDVDSSVLYPVTYSPASHWISRAG